MRIHSPVNKTWFCCCCRVRRGGCGGQPSPVPGQLPLQPLWALHGRPAARLQPPAAWRSGRQPPHLRPPAEHLPGQRGRPGPLPLLIHPQTQVPPVHHQGGGAPVILSWLYLWWDVCCSMQGFGAGAVVFGWSLSRHFSPDPAPP